MDWLDFWDVLDEVDEVDGWWCDFRLSILDFILNLNRFAMVFKWVPPLRHAALRSACLRSG